MRFNDVRPSGIIPISHGCRNGNWYKRKKKQHFHRHSLFLFYFLPLLFLLQNMFQWFVMQLLLTAIQKVTTKRGTHRPRICNTTVMWWKLNGNDIVRFVAELLCHNSGKVRKKKQQTTFLFQGYIWFLTLFFILSFIFFWLRFSNC